MHIRHGDFRRQFFPTQSDAPWRQASFVCSPRRTNSSGARPVGVCFRTQLERPRRTLLGHFFFENPPKMHAKWEKLLSSVPLVNFVDRKVAITSLNYPICHATF